ncbi:thermonuclease family protein [Parapedobacter sp.]
MLCDQYDAAGHIRVFHLKLFAHKNGSAMVVNDTINLNERLLEAGLAWHYKSYDRNPEWAMTENTAKKAQYGLWAEKDAVAPWDWRKRKQTGRSE